MWEITHVIHVEIPCVDFVILQGVPLASQKVTPKNILPRPWTDSEAKEGGGMEEGAGAGTKQFATAGWCVLGTQGRLQKSKPLQVGELDYLRARIKQAFGGKQARIHYGWELAFPYYCILRTSKTSG